MLHVIYFLVLIAVLLSALLINLWTLPGNWLMLAAVAVYALLTRDKGYVGLTSLGIMLALAVTGEIVEMLASSRGVKRRGGSRWGSIGALIGGILGGILLTGLVPIPILGTLCGILIGTFAGAMVLEFLGGKQITRSALIGYGAAYGRLMGTLLKFAIGCAILLIGIIAAIPWHG